MQVGELWRAYCSISGRLHPNVFLKDGARHYLKAYETVHCIRRYDSIPDFTVQQLVDILADYSDLYDFSPVTTTVEDRTYIDGWWVTLKNRDAPDPLDCVAPLHPSLYENA